MSSLVRIVSLVFALSLCFGAAPVIAMQDTNQGQTSSAQQSASRAVCTLTGDCPGNGNRPHSSICPDNGPCIPASPAWLPDGPLATNAQKPGGFPALDPADPMAVPLPAPSLLLVSALFGLGVMSRRTRRRKTN